MSWLSVGDCKRLIGSDLPKPPRPDAGVKRAYVPNEKQKNAKIRVFARTLKATGSRHEAALKAGYVRPEIQKYRLTRRGPDGEYLNPGLRYWLAQDD